jgi:hypothetical protein
VGQRLFQRLGESLSGADVGVIEPDRPVAVVVGEGGLKPARMSPRIAPAIADEDLGAGQTSFQPGSKSDSSNLLSGATRFPHAVPSSASSWLTCAHNEYLTSPFRHLLGKNPYMHVVSETVGMGISP